MGRYPEVEKLLSDYSGLDIQSIGRQIFERAIESRLSELSEGSYADYLTKLEAQEGELNELLGLLLVPETWFFRDSGTFAFLASFIKSEWYPKADRAVLHVLSAPCSTGEEPYSIAIALLEAGLTPSQFRIHASDISPKTLARAKAGNYADGSFRTPLTAAQARFFNRGKERSTVCESVRALVAFKPGNLVDPNFMAGSETRFDIIFCKNLMIYLGEAGRARVMANLNRLLKDSGLLFVGHSEVAAFQKAGYKPLSSAKAFGLTKMGHRDEPRPIHTHRRVTKPRPTHDSRRPSGSRPTVVSKVASRKEPADPKPAVPVLETARTLADRGELEQAADLCRSLVAEEPMNVGAYYLAGLIEQSLDRLATAEEHFLKAIYLDPDHYDTLVQLCLLGEKKGDSLKAAQYRKRLRRLEAKAKKG